MLMSTGHNYSYFFLILCMRFTNMVSSSFYIAVVVVS